MTNENELSEINNLKIRLYTLENQVRILNEEVKYLTRKPFFTKSIFPSPNPYLDDLLKEMPYND